MRRMRIVLGPVPCHGCHAPVYFSDVRWGATPGRAWRDQQGQLHNCEAAGRARRWQVAPYGPAQEHWTAIRIAIESGQTEADVARAFGLSRERVRQIWSAQTGQGLPIPRHHLRRPEHELIPTAQKGGS